MQTIKLFSEILGKQIEIPEKPSRIVSLAPAITDMLYTLEAWERVAGVSIFCNKPPQAKEKPRVGSYYKVNYKLLEKLKPDLILVTTGAQRDRIYELEEKGFTVYPIPLPTDLNMLISNIITLGHVIGEKRKAYKIANKLTSMLHDLKSEKKIGTVYYEIDLGGPTSIGGITYVDHAFNVIGLENIFSDLRTTWIVNPDTSYILKKNPDIVLYEKKPFDPSSKEKIIARLEERGLGQLEAVREGRIMILEPDTLAHYGPSLLDDLQAIKYRAIELLQGKKK
ncbi:MAG: ABC transporter substrate-binding protein [Desulfurococcales archaeon]|nr:ABC transporter substrate-binding protein [Desulfurococcales archaeon]